MMSAEGFVTHFSEYVAKTADPALLAMNKQQAEHILRHLRFSAERFRELEHALSERIRISERQGKHSQEQKRLKAEQRAAT
jgi:hypothetical protein